MIELSPLPEEKTGRPRSDWLVHPDSFRAGVYRGETKDEIVLTNGLIRRTWRLAPNAATVGYDNLMTGESVIRGVKPEAIVELEGERFDVGGLNGQKEYAYLRREWLDGLQSDPEAFQLADFEVDGTKAHIPWKRTRHAPDLPWPPPGASLKLCFRPPEGKLEGLQVKIHYELYDGVPLLCKWLTINNNTGRSLRLNAFTSEILAVVEYESTVDAHQGWRYPNMHVESDYGFTDINPRHPRSTTHWVPDPQYTTQVDYRYETPCLLQSRPPNGPHASIENRGTFESFRTFELIYDSTGRERQGLARRRMYRTVAPWSQENPILMHVRGADPEAVRRAVDQCAEVGFEMVIMTFGSGFDLENEDPQYIEQIRELADYAHSKGVELGGYSLLASRRVSDEHDVVDSETGKTDRAIFGHSPCLCSEWGGEYFRKLKTFFKRTGLDVLEHDGSYPGDWCASTEHPDHEGLEDSQWRQWRRITDFYRWCRSEGIYLNVPDWYFLSGSNKNGMGYREVNWSLPRERQILLARQNMYDGTWEKTPSMGWMFVPLVEYHGGGTAATLEPLDEHLDAYEAHLAQNFGSGVQACYRGPRLYDTEKTRAVVRKWVDFFRRHRAILESDTIHLHRPDGRDLDGVLHVNPHLEERGLLMVFNPLDEPVKQTLLLPLYYTGLTETASIREQEGGGQIYELDREYRVELPVEVEARGRIWFVIEAETSAETTYLSSHLPIPHPPSPHPPIPPSSTRRIA